MSNATVLSAQGASICITEFPFPLPSPPAPEYLEGWGQARGEEGMEALEAVDTTECTVSYNGQ